MTNNITLENEGGLEGLYDLLKELRKGFGDSGPVTVKKKTTTDEHDARVKTFLKKLDGVFKNALKRFGDKSEEVLEGTSDVCLKTKRPPGRPAAQFDWAKNARPNQRVPAGCWVNWLILAGRGFGKTRTGAETIRQWVNDGVARRIALVGHTMHDVRSVMVDGVTGLMNICPNHERPKLEVKQNQLVWPNGAIAQFFSSEAYESLRGPQFDTAWVDELAKFRSARETWDQLMFCMRASKTPRTIITTTPRPIPIIKELVDDESTIVTRGSTMDNKENLPKAYLTHMQKLYGGTSLGAQELEGLIVEENWEALWSQNLFQYQKIVPEDLVRIVVAVDPALTNHKRSDQTGIMVVGKCKDGNAYVLEDLTRKGTPNMWAHTVVRAYKKWNADRIVAEVNAGGDLVEQVIRTMDPSVSFKGVRATRGKVTRAEPVSALYEQGKVFHIKRFLELEEQLCGYIPGTSKKSPDRMDALVWGVTSLLLEQQQTSPKIWVV